MAESTRDGVRLRVTNESDRDALIAIRRTPEVLARWRDGDLDDEFSKDLNDEETTQFTILDVDTAEVLGLVQFYEEEEPDYRHGAIDVFVSPAHHRQGIATAALSLVIQHAFETLGHHRITIDPSADNAAAIGCYAGLGFKPCLLYTSDAADE